MNNNPRIAVLLPYSENFSPLKAGALSLFAYESTICSRHKEFITVYGKFGVGAYEKVPYCGLKPKWRWFLGRNKGLAAAFNEVIKQNLPDLIEIHNRPSMFLYLKKKIPNVPISLFFHNDPQSMKHAKTVEERQFLLERSSAIVCISEYTKERFLDGLNVSDNLSNKVKIVFHGIRRTSEYLPEKDNTILYAGRLVDEKGIAELIEAATIVLPKFPNWKFTIVGAKRHGQYEKGQSDFERRLYNAFDKLGSQGEFLGQRPYDQVLRLYQNAAIAVVPSKWDEPLGRTAIEALAEGCALISSDRGGLKEINNGCGIVLKDVTATEIEEKLKELMSNTDLLHDVQKKCWDSYNRFKLSTVVESLDVCRDEILNPAK